MPLPLQLREQTRALEAFGTNRVTVSRHTLDVNPHALAGSVQRIERSGPIPLCN
jgi:hypothetical protein